MQLVANYASEKEPVSRASLVCVIVLAAAGGLVVSVVNVGDRGLLLIGTSAVLLVPLFARVCKRQFDPFEPLVIIVVAYGAMFVVRPLAMMARNDFAYSAGSGSPLDPHVNLSRGFNSMLLLGLLGALSFMIGYAISAGRSFALRVSAPRDRQAIAFSVAVAGAFAFLGIALFGALIVSGGGSSAWVLLLQGRSIALSQLLIRSDKYFLYGPLLLLPASLTLLGLGHLRRSKVLLLLGTCTGLTLVLTAAPSGNRSELFTFAAGLAILFYVVRARRPSAPTLVISCLIFLALSSVILQLRTVGPSRAAGVGQALQSLAARPLSVFDPITSQNDAAEAPGLAAALSLPPGQLPETYGASTGGDLVTRAIPRSAWPGKPYPPRQRIAALLLGNQNTYVNGASPEFSVLLYPYLDFRLPGTIAFMFACGIAIRALWEYFRLHRHTLFAQLLLALVCPALVAGVRDGPVDTTVRLLFTLVPLWLSLRPGLSVSSGRPRRGELAHETRALPTSLA